MQNAFLWAAGDRQQPFKFTKPEDFPAFSDLKTYARAYHDDAARLAQTVSDTRLAETFSVPWFKDPPLTITIQEGLLQAAMYSHYHRGQNATRLRELGGEPPTTDFIVWLWKGRPAATWE